MQFSSLPTKFTIAWANAAGGGYTGQVPTASQIGITAGAASLTDGFPPANFLPVGSGGTPPRGVDFNGILNQITAWSRWQNAGGTVQYDSVFSSAVGGYPQGAIVSSTVSGGLWLSLVDNNTANPDAGGTNWVPIVTAVAANVTLYVSTSGNDTTGTGTSGNPFATIARAVQFGSTRNSFAGYSLTIQLAVAGSYAAPGVLPVLGGTLNIIGNTSSQSTYIISGAGPAGGNSGLIAVYGGTLNLEGVTVTNTGTSNTNVLAVSGASVILQYVTFSTTGSAPPSFITASASGSVQIGAGCIINSSAGACLEATGGGAIIIAAQINVPANQACTYWGLANLCGVIQFISTSYTFSGTGGSGGGSTGNRYLASNNGVIYTGGMGATAFPGNVGGTTSNGGQYV